MVRALPSLHRTLDRRSQKRSVREQPRTDQTHRQTQTQTQTTSTAAATLPARLRPPASGLTPTHAEHAACRPPKAGGRHASCQPAPAHFVRVPSGGAGPLPAHLPPPRPLEKFKSSAARRGAAPPPPKTASLRSRAALPRGGPSRRPARKRAEPNIFNQRRGATALARSTSQPAQPNQTSDARARTAPERRSHSPHRLSKIGR